MSATCQTEIAFGGGNGVQAHLGHCGEPAVETGPHGSWCAEHSPNWVITTANTYGPETTLHERLERRLVALDDKVMERNADRCREIDDLKARLSRAEDHIARLVKANGDLVERVKRTEFSFTDAPLRSSGALALIAGQFHACPSCGVKFATTEEKMAHYDAGCGATSSPNLLTREAQLLAARRFVRTNDPRGVARRIAAGVVAPVVAALAAAAGLVALGSFAWQHAAGIMTWVGF